ncbi:MAG: hypothetical protein HQM12_09535 [SAR324 cluster bacterium]|nr:hypothetical protein [SAR324 cluster bacterium]
MESIIQDMISLRVSGGEFDSESIDNAIRVCEKLDLVFEGFSSVEKKVFLENYEFFDSQYKFSLFLKLLFQGGLEHKEAYFRILFRKLDASQSVIRSVLATKTLFDSPNVEQQICYELEALIDSLTQSFIALIPPSLKPDPNQKLTFRWLKDIATHKGPIFIEGEVPYSQMVRKYADLIHDILGHPQLPIYLKWRDQFLQHWLLEVLRNEDQFNTNPVPTLNSIKADVYAEYSSWTKISKQLNTNLRHRQFLQSEQVIQTEKNMLERLPSNILGQIVFDIRNRIKKETDENVELGFDDAMIQETSIYSNIMDDVVQYAEQHQEKPSSWFHAFIHKVKEIFVPQAQEKPVTTQERSDLKERRYPEKFISPVKTDRMRFGKNFPQDYQEKASRYFTLFFSYKKGNLSHEFEQFVQDVLNYYEEYSRTSVVPTLHKFASSQTGSETTYTERCLALPTVLGQQLLVLGTTCFIKTGSGGRLFTPQSYFLWLEFVPNPAKDQQILRSGTDAFLMHPLDQLGARKEVIYDAFLQIIDSLPDTLRTQPHIQTLIQVCHEYAGEVPNW